MTLALLAVSGVLELTRQERDRLSPHDCNIRRWESTVTSRYQSSDTKRTVKLPQLR
jgi:hypothetical protein